MRQNILIFCAFLLLSFVARAENASYTPKPGTKERKAILDVVRGPIEKKLKYQVIFRVKHLKVKDGWAFLQATPRTKEDKAIDFRGTPYEEDAAEMDEMLVAILHLKDERWQVVDKALFQTDVWWWGIHEKIGAPEEIFDYYPMKK